MAKSDKNPRGLLRPKDGSGRGIGRSGGQRSAQNTDPCNRGGPGRGQGGGRGRGEGRKDK